ncbi:hypothetical protein EJ03DRAFT_355659 [Teratosphaeria nubilosa]|uniref:Uncharacterized protein n=1 Tax=Teratosphaeria nubilosa TaxID=161662 RepID=A0A6G1KWL2_9PEZI|nr:hypothetical protein EJ03DRAFT_355659 [Teratosphaeria nubilosa]
MSVKTIASVQVTWYFAYCIRDDDKGHIFSRYTFEGSIPDFVNWAWPHGYFPGDYWYNAFEYFYELRPLRRIASCRSHTQDSAFRFLDLPRELRTMVYVKCFEDGCFLKILKDRGLTSPFAAHLFLLEEESGTIFDRNTWMSLLRVSRQVRHDVQQDDCLIFRSLPHRSIATIHSCTSGSGSLSLPHNYCSSELEVLIHLEAFSRTDELGSCLRTVCAALPAETHTLNVYICIAGFAERKFIDRFDVDKVDLPVGKVKIKLSWVTGQCLEVRRNERESKHTPMHQLYQLQSGRKEAKVIATIPYTWAHFWYALLRGVAEGNFHTDRLQIEPDGYGRISASEWKILQQLMPKWEPRLPTSQ